MIIDELKGLQALHGLSQERLAHTLGYSDQGSLSKILHRTRDLPILKASQLDKAGYRTSLGISFEELARKYQDSKSVKTWQGERRLKEYDIFLASPMASGESYVESRRKALALQATIENYCGYSVYYAGHNVAGREDFDTADIAFIDNRMALEASRMFVLYVTEQMAKPSSVWVEAGMALGIGIQSHYFVPNPDSLPYILQRAVLPREEGGSSLTAVHWIGEDAELPIQRVRRHRQQLFHIGE